MLFEGRENQIGHIAFLKPNRSVSLCLFLALFFRLMFDVIVSRRVFDHSTIHMFDNSLNYLLEGGKNNGGSKNTFGWLTNRICSAFIRI